MTDKYDQLERIGNLFKKWLLTKEEFETEKTKILLDETEIEEKNDESGMMNKFMLYTSFLMIIILIIDIYLYINNSQIHDNNLNILNILYYWFIIYIIIIAIIIFKMIKIEENIRKDQGIIE